VYVTGESSSDYVTIKYDTNGTLVWLMTYNGSANSYDVANDIAVDNSGHVYVTGESYNSSGNGDYATIKYVQPIPYVTEGLLTVPQKFSLRRALSNPCRSFTGIQFELPRASTVTLSIYDISGRLVSEPVNGFYEAGIYETRIDVSFLNSGVYFCRLKDDGHTAIEKVIVTK
jgi:hypothetical protein